MALQAADEQVSGSNRGEMCSESGRLLPRARPPPPDSCGAGAGTAQATRGAAVPRAPTGSTRQATWLGVRNERRAARAGGRTGRSRGRIRLESVSVRVAVTGGTRRADDAAEMECGPVCHAREPPCAPRADRSEADHVGGAISASCRRQFASERPLSRAEWPCGDGTCRSEGAGGAGKMRSLTQRA